MDSPFLGQIQTFGFNFAPRGWALCTGQLLSISQNTALFALLGTQFGGNGVSTFQLPDFQGRCAVGTGNGNGLQPIVIGQIGGVENVSILTSNMPAHTHIATATSTLNGSDQTNDKASPSGNLLGVKPQSYFAPGTGNLLAMAATSIATTVANANTGGNLPIAVRNPYLGVTVAIALSGIFPSRN